MKTRYFIIAVMTVMLCGCARTPSTPALVPAGVPIVTPLTLVAEGDMPLLADDLDPESLDLAVSRSLKYLDKGLGSRYRFGDRDVSAADIKESLLAFRDIMRTPDTPEKKMEKIRNSFDFYKAAGTDGRGTVVYTGYYETVLNGSLEKTERFMYPLYRTPPELMAGTKNTEKMYYSREEIDTKGVLQNRNLEIAWVDDPVALYSMHIQGSGKIMLPDGGTIRVSYARDNGRLFRSHTEYMVEAGVLQGGDKSYWTVKKYLQEHPESRQRIFNYNERYIFFRIVETPTGALGVPVTGGRSIAIDHALFPKAGIAFIRLRKPTYDKTRNRREWEPFSRFVLSQDVGKAIKGPGRVDLFCGGGDDAELVAGSLKEKGELYFLIRKRI